MNEANARRLRLVATGGEGRPLVLVHGFGSDRMSWLANQTVLQSARRVYTLDLPGHGAEAFAERSLAEIAEIVAQAVEREISGECDFLGHSLGAAICMLVAHERPELVRSLVLIAPAGLGKGVDRNFLELFPRLEAPDEAEALLARLVSRPRLINKQMIAYVLAQLERPGRREALASIAGMLATDTNGIAQAAAAIRDRSTPRLTLWGEDDRINPADPAALGSFGGSVIFLPGAGHLPHVESSCEVNAAVLSFLAEGN